MTFSFKRVYAIFQKDLKDLTKNIFVGTTLLIPVLLAVLYVKLGEQSIEIHFLVINLTFTTVAAFIQCTLIAEEKEKNTLRSLMLSPATTFEILGGKSLLSFIFTIVTVFICALITGYESKNIFIISLAIFISSLFYLELGTLLGLLTKSVMEASVVILPVMFLFGFGTMFQVLIEKYSQLSFLEYLPNIQLLELAKSVESGVGLLDVWIKFAVISGWVVAGGILVVIVYKNRAMDD